MLLAHECCLVQLLLQSHCFIAASITDVSVSKPPAHGITHKEEIGTNIINIWYEILVHLQLGEKCYGKLTLLTIDRR